MTDALKDAYGRHLTYLRISLTQQCNFRCRYCLPPEGMSCQLPQEGLSLEDYVRVARLFLSLGGEKVKLTGGEPLVYPYLISLVEQLCALPRLKDLGLTTNGFFLERLAPQLWQAGLRRVNVSLDSLNPLRFAYLTRSQGFHQVWKGIEVALATGFQVKLNVVAMKGLSSAEITEVVSLAQRTPLEIRFIEFMPLCGSGWHPEWVLPLSEVEAICHQSASLQVLPRGSATAKTYQMVGGAGRLGFIASMTEPFCANCTRMRLSSEGKLYPCLFSHVAIDLKSALRFSSDDNVIRCITQAVQDKPAGHGVVVDQAHRDQYPSIRMIGG